MERVTKLTLREGVRCVFVCSVTRFTWQASSLCCANFSSFPSGSPLLMKASTSSSSRLSRPQLSSHRIHSCKQVQPSVLTFDVSAQTPNSRHYSTGNSTFVYLWIYIALSKCALQTWVLLWEATSCSRACCCKALALTSSCTHSSSWHFSASGSRWNRFCTNANWDLRTCRSFWITKRPEVKWNNCKVGLMHKARDVETETECDIFHRERDSLINKLQEWNTQINV